jgi:hypothetical protein
MRTKVHLDADARRRSPWRRRAIAGVFGIAGLLSFVAEPAMAAETTWFPWRLRVSKDNYALCGQGMLQVAESPSSATFGYGVTGMFSGTNCSGYWSSGWIDANALIYAWTPYGWQACASFVSYSASSNASVVWAVSTNEGGFWCTPRFQSLWAISHASGGYITGTQYPISGMWPWVDTAQWNGG